MQSSAYYLGDSSKAPKSSWLNLIERWFAELTNKRIRRGSFLSVDDLIAAINEFVEAWNEKPKPFVWTATVDSICGGPQG